MRTLQLLMLAGIVCLALAGLVSAVNVECPATPPYPPCCISSEWWNGGWIYLVFTGISVILLFFGLIYMAAAIFSKPEWVVWIKDEFFQICISVIIVGMLVIVLSTVCDVFITLAGRDPFLIAHTYINGLVWDKTLNLATDAFTQSIICQMIAAYRLQAGPPSMGMSVQPGIGLRAIAVCFDYIYAFFAGISASLMVQDLGLSIIQAFAFRIMLPIGILLRIFPFIRKAGAMLIALALGLYIVYPLCFVMNQMIATSATNSMNLPAVENNWEYYLTAVLSPYFLVAVPVLFSQMKSAALLIPQAVFLPTLNLVITLTFIKNASRILSQNFSGGSE